MKNVPMTKNNRINIVQRAREILSDRKHWTSGKLRKQSISGGYDGFQYCLLGACELALYELGLSNKIGAGFGGAQNGEANTIDAYVLGRELGLADYSQQKFNDRTPDDVNDRLGYDKVLELLDGFLAQEKGVAA